MVGSSRTVSCEVEPPEYSLARLDWNVVIRSHCCAHQTCIPEHFLPCCSLKGIHDLQRSLTLDKVTSTYLNGYVWDPRFFYQNLTKSIRTSSSMLTTVALLSSSLHIVLQKKKIKYTSIYLQSKWPSCDRNIISLTRLSPRKTKPGALDSRSLLIIFSLFCFLKETLCNYIKDACPKKFKKSLWTCQQIIGPLPNHWQCLFKTFDLTVRERLRNLGVFASLFYVSWL